MHIVFQIFTNTWHYTQEAAPWLLIGFLFAGLLKAFLPTAVLLKYIGGKNIKSILTATVIGIPLPLCSCGVIPTGMGLYKQGASRASTLAFLIATPATTVTTIIISIGMLGWHFTTAAVITCFAVAAITGVLSLRLLPEADRQKPAAPKDNQCAHPLATAPACPHCRRNLKEGLKTTFRFGFIEMVNDVGKYIILGLFLAGLIATVFPPTIVDKYLAKGFLPLIIMVLVATPMYICSTASIPFVAALIAKGMHPAAGLVFLIAGPATNASTIMAIWKIMGKNTALLYLTAIILLSVFIAYIFYLTGWLC